MKKEVLLYIFLWHISFASVAQNIGIGTATPASKLHVKGTGSGTQIVLEENAGSILRISNEPSGTGPYIGTTTNNPFSFVTNNNVRAVINTSGNFGIGVSIPQQQLSVGGGVVVDQNNSNTGTSANAILSFGSLSGEGIGSKRNAGTGQGGLDFYTNNTHRMIVTNNGNIGINVINPSSKLEVRGALGFSSTTKRWEMNYDSTNQYFYIDEFGAGRRFYIRNGGNTGIGMVPFAGNTRLQVNTPANSNAMAFYHDDVYTGAIKLTDTTMQIMTEVGLAICSPQPCTPLAPKHLILSPPVTGIGVNGNVGIGTNSPTEKLSVAGSVIVDNNNLNNGLPGNMLRFGTNSGEGIGSKRTAGGNQYGLDFYTDSVRRMTISNTGNVGINNVLPKNKLTITHTGTPLPSGIVDEGHAFLLMDSSLYSQGEHAVYAQMGTQSGFGTFFMDVHLKKASGPKTQTPKMLINPFGDGALIVGGGWGNYLTTSHKFIVASNGSSLFEGNISTNGNLSVQDNTLLSGTLQVNGNSTFNNSMQVNGNVTSSGNGNFNGQVTVANNKGVIRNTNTTQLKHVVTTTQVTRAGIAQKTFTEHTVNWSENFSSNPVTAYLADIPGGFGFELLDIKIKNVSATGCIVVVSNPTDILFISCDFTLKIVAIGPS